MQAVDALVSKQNKFEKKNHIKTKSLTKTFLKPTDTMFLLKIKRMADPSDGYYLTYTVSNLTPSWYPKEKH